MPRSLSRAISGAWRLPRGIVFLVFHPSLLPLVVLPAVIAGILLAGGLGLGLWAAPFVEERLVKGGPFPPGLELLVGFLIWVATLSAGAALGFGLALLLVSPILERLSRRVERIVRGVADERGSGLAWEVKESLRGAFYFLAAAPGIFLLAFIPPPLPSLAK